VASRNWDELLTVSQVAAEYKISEETVRRWMKGGHIPFIPVGPFKIKRIRRGDVVKNAYTGETLEQEDEPVVMKGSNNGK
jgi:excisionase family DNA binding protein